MGPLQREQAIFHVFVFISTWTSIMNESRPLHWIGMYIIDLKKKKINK